MGASNLSRAADVTEYRVRISDLDNIKAKEEFICYDDKRFCRTMLPVRIEGANRNLDVIAFFEPGNAYFSFSIANKFLSIGSEKVFLMPIGHYGIQESKVSLRPSLPEAESQDIPPAIPPVLRYSDDIIANIKITIHYVSTYSYDPPAGSP
jgi:hypothetical protein